MTEQFITERRYLKAVSPKTEAWYRDSFKAFEGALDSRSTIIQRIAELRERGVKPVSVNTWLRCINAYFMWLHKEHGKELLRMPRLKEEQKILATLTEKDISMLIGWKATPINNTNLRRAHLVALTILSTGLRASEVLGLRREAVDFDNLVLRVKGKGNKERLVPFGVELRKLLFKFTQGTLNNTSRAYIFGTKNGTQVSVRNLERDFKILGKRIGISGVRFSPHTLRHNFAVSWIRGGGDIYMLSRVLGHSSITVTAVYLKSVGIEDIRATYNRVSILDQMKRSV